MSKRRAIIFGVNKYPDKKIHDLFGAVGDATGIKKRLEEYGGFTVPHFYTDEQATADNIRKAIHDLLWNPEELEIALIYFAGHGFKDPYGIGYIAPHNMVLNEPFVYGIGMAELKTAIGKAINKTVIIAILDCCHSGISIDRGSNTEGFENFDEYFDKDLQTMGEGKFILAACGADQKAREIKVNEDQKDVFHGAFSYYLLEGLDGEASNGEGVITLEKWYDHAHKAFSQSGTQKPKRYAVSSGGSIEIAKSPEKHQKYLDGLLTQIQSLVTTNESISIIDACMKLKKFQCYDPAHPSAQTCIAQIENHFKSIKVKASQYLIDNITELHGRIPNVRKEVKELIPKLSFSKTCEMTPKQRNLMGVLCEACSDNSPISDFIDQVSHMEREAPSGDKS